MRERELVIEMPTAPAPWVDPLPFQSAISLPDGPGAAGRCVVAMDAQPVQAGVIYLPDDLKAKIAPEAGWVVVANHKSPVVPGQRVLVRPYHGMWMENFNGTGKELRFYGVGWPVRESILMYEVQGEWRCLPNWIRLRRIEPDRGFLVSDRFTKSKPQLCEVVDDGNGELAPGTRVLCRNLPEDGIGFSGGSMQGTELIEVVRDGERLVWCEV